ncbi:MAG: peptidylprolyl isomerase [Elainellaceae cyanobacterium]
MRPIHRSSRPIILMILTALLAGLVLIGWSQPATADSLISRLPPGNAVTDGGALLRYALPIENKPVRRLQEALEGISETLRVQGSRRVSSINRNIKTANRVLARPEKILTSIPADHTAEAEALLSSIGDGLNTLQAAVDAEDKEAVWIERGKLLGQVGDLEELMIEEFPFEIPAEYSDLPQLKGRATIEMTFRDKGTVRLVVDGYNAPITAGNFVDLVQRGFYDGLPVTRAEKFYVVQLGDPPGPEDGFIDPKTDEYRTIPLEVMIDGDSEPLYGITMEDAGRYLDDPVLPFSAYGAVAMARPGDDPNGGSSQFFFFLFEPELTPAGLNLLDGRYAVFGYVTENKGVLDNLDVGDRVESAQVVKGLDNLVEPQAA